MSGIVEAINGAFEALFYGGGSWFGLLLMLSICIGLIVKWKYTSALILPVTVFLALDYMGRDLMWHAIIMFFTSIFTVLYMANELIKKK